MSCHTSINLIDDNFPAYVSGRVDVKCIANFISGSSATPEQCDTVHQGRVVIISPPPAPNTSVAAPGSDIAVAL